MHFQTLWMRKHVAISTTASFLQLVSTACTRHRFCLQGSWAIGLLHGPSPLELAPYQQQIQEQSSTIARIGPAAGPAAAPGPANPILTCASLAQPPSNFVADPFLWLGHGGGSTLLNGTGTASRGGAAGNASLAGDPQVQMHVFFETKTNTDMQGEAACALASRLEQHCKRAWSLATVPADCISVHALQQCHGSWMPSAASSYRPTVTPTPPHPRTRRRHCGGAV